MVNEPQRVLRTITRLNIGGPARQALLLTRRLRPDYDTTLAAGRPTASEGELSDPNVAITSVPLVRPVRPLDDARSLAAVRGLLRSVRPAIVHSHMAKAGTITRLAARTLRDRPVVVHTFHGHVLEGYFSPRVQAAFLRAERVLARSSDVLVAVSEEVRADLLDRGIGRPEQVRVIPLGFDLEAHRAVSGRSGLLRERLGLSDDAVLAGIVGRLVPIKDVGTALAAVARTSDVHLAVVGDGELRAEIEAQAVALGLTGRVHFTGWMTDVPGVMADLDVAVLSSRNEGTPVALIEAAACGVPAVATDVGGVRAVVRDGVTGLLVPPADPGAMATAIDALAGDATRRAAFGRAAREASHRFSADRLVDDIRSLYAELLDQR